MPAPDDEFLAHLLDLFRRWAPVAARRMFGGYGLFRDGIMFGIVVDETVYLKTDEGNRGAFETAGMAPFRYRRSGKTVALSYHELPADLLDGGEDLAGWAEDAFSAARRGRRKPRARP